ncbi:MAG: glycosyltransferase family 87 protein, partial [Bacteroidota bacterium]
MLFPRKSDRIFFIPYLGGVASPSLRQGANILQNLLIMPSWFRFIWSGKFQLVVYLLLALLISGQSLQRGSKTFVEGGASYTHYNNYQIFKHAFHHLVDGKDLYRTHPEDHFDLYKYSPGFAVFMSVFSLLPDGVGLALWNLLNALLLFWAIHALPRLPDRHKQLIGWLVLLELIGSLQNSQSNGLMAGLLLGAFVFLERRRDWLGTLLLVLSVFIKL